MTGKPVLANSLKVLGFCPAVPTPFQKVDSTAPPAISGDKKGETGATGSTGKTGATGTATSVTYDDLIDLIHSVNSAYRVNARFMLIFQIIQKKILLLGYLRILL